MSETLTNHEKYMAGIPLNEELEKLARGEMPEEEPVQPAPVSQANSGGIGKLTRTDRIALKELRQSDGWGALQKLLKIAVQKHRESAILVSEQDPGGSDASEGWKILATVKRAYSDVQALVDEEVKRLDGKEKGGKLKGFWSDTRPNGKPVEHGTVCFITDLEDGTHPIATYGKDREEVFDKLARQNANAQIALARRAAQPPPQSAGAQPVQVPARQPVSADRIMQATADLQNPAKAADAIATLIEVNTGINPAEQALHHFATLAERWEDNNPDFYQHPGNKSQIANRVFRIAGGKWGAVTSAMLDRAFNELLAEGLLFEAPEEPTQQQPSTLTTFPSETPVQRTERPRGTRFATGTRSTSFGAPQTVQTRTLKYSEEQIRTMPTSKQRELVASNDADYAAACEAYFGQRATA